MKISGIILLAARTAPTYLNFWVRPMGRPAVQTSNTGHSENCIGVAWVQLF